MTGPPRDARAAPIGPRPPPRIAGVFELAWPSTALFALNALVGVVDFVFVSSLGAKAIASVGVAYQIHSMVFALLAAVTTGTVAVVARRSGAGDVEATRRALQTSVWLAAAIGLALTAALPFSETLVGAMGVEREVVELGGSCLRILMLCNVPFAVELTVAMGLRGAGDVRTPLAIGLVTNAVNVVADYALIFGRFGAPALGAPGSALATGISFTLGTSILLALWARGGLVIPWGSWRGSLSREMAARLLRIGIPTALEQGAFNLGLLIFVAVVATFGTEPVSAYLIGVRILSLCFVPGFGIATAASTLVGQHLGAAQPRRASRSGWRAAGGAVAVMGSVGLAIIASAQQLAGWFGAAGAETTALTVTFIHILGAAQPLMAVEFALGGALRGAGDTRFPLFAILVGLFFFRLGGAWLVAIPVFGSVRAVWSCLLVDYLVKALLLAGRFASGRWKSTRV